MTRRQPIRRPRCRDCDALLQEGPAGLRCPWSRTEAVDCGWPKGGRPRDQYRPTTDYSGPTRAWR